MTRPLRITLLLLLSALAWLPCAAEVRLPNVLSDHAVLQRDRPIHLWGMATPGAHLVTRFHGQSATTNADDLGRWSLYLQPEAAGGPFQLSITGDGPEKILSDLLVGDVWFASGQSNMEMPMSGFPPSAHLKDADAEIAAAHNSMLRLLVVQHKSSDFPLNDADGSWTDCRPETAKNFSAVAYFFGRDLARDQHVPIGLEIGPHSALKGPIRAILGAAPRTKQKIEYSCALVRKENAVMSTLKLASELFMKGYSLDMSAVNFPNNAPKLKVLSDLPPYPWNHETEFWHESRISQSHRMIAVTAFALMGSVGSAQAGCLTGALVGGIAGHFAHHGLAGAGRRLRRRPLRVEVSPPPRAASLLIASARGGSLGEVISPDFRSRRVPPRDRPAPADRPDRATQASPRSTRLRGAEPAPAHDRLA